jgi:hypothetical protein
MADWARLSKDEQAKFWEFLRDDFMPAVEEYEKNPAGYRWPASLRFERLTKTKSVCAVTWSFSGPDGRATFHLDLVDGKPMLVWRRVGRHSIYKNP